jgi:hypothetical protein
LLGLCASASAVTIGFETSEGYTTTGGTTFANGNLVGQGISPNNWTGSTSADADKLRVIANPVTTGNPSDQVVQLFDTNNTGTQLYRIFSPSTGETFDPSSSIISYSLQFLYPSGAATNASAEIRFAVGDAGSGKQIFQLEFVSDGTIGFNDGTTNSKVLNSEGNNFVGTTGTWVTISGTINYGTNLYTLNVDGVQQLGTDSSSNLDFYATDSKTAVLNLRAMGATGANYTPIYLDNLDFTAIPEPGTSAAMVFGVVLLGAAFLRVRRRRQSVR